MKKIDFRVKKQDILGLLMFYALALAAILSRYAIYLFR